MEGTAAKSYYIAYDSVSRFLSIRFVHHYLFIWSLALISAIVLPTIYLISPSVLKTTRTPYLVLLCLICAGNLGYPSIQVYLLSGKGQLLLPFHLCRSIVYFSSFGKPLALYLTCLFSFERLLTKILAKFFVTIERYRQWTRTIFIVLIFLTVTSIVVVRLYQVLNLIRRPSTPAAIGRAERNTNISDPNMTFTSCLASMDINQYATFLSFYVLQYWYEYLVFALILINLCVFLFFQCCLPASQTNRTRPSTNTRIYLILAIYLINVEAISTLFHLVVDDVNNINDDIQLTGLEFLLHILNVRCLALPLIVGVVLSIPLKQFLFELFFTRPFLDQIEEADQPTSTTTRRLDEEHLQEDDFHGDL